MTMQSARADLSASVCLNPNGSKRAQRAPLASMSTSRGGAPAPRKAASSSTRLTLHPKRTRTPSSKQSLKSECCSCASTDPARSKASQSHRYTEALSEALGPRRSGGGPYLGSHQESSGVIRSHQEASVPGKSSGVIRSHQESSGVIRRERTCEVPQRRTSSEAKIEGSSSFTPSSAKSRSTHGHRWSTCSLVKRSRPSSTCVLTASQRQSEAITGHQRPSEAIRGHHW
jgi:hypothetical protein